MHEVSEVCKMTLPGPAHSSQQLHWNRLGLGLHPAHRSCWQLMFLLRLYESQRVRVASAEHLCGRFKALVSLCAGVFCPWRCHDAQNKPICTAGNSVSNQSATPVSRASLKRREAGGGHNPAQKCLAGLSPCTGISVRPLKDRVLR